MAEAQKKTNLDYVNEIWNIADYVRDVISRADYNKVVLPFALLRRLECALEPTRAAVCDAVKEHEKDWGRESDNYCQYSSKAFYNVTPFRLNNLGAGDTYAALDSYINGFSPNARNIMLKFDMESTCVRSSKITACFIPSARSFQPSRSIQLRFLTVICPTSMSISFRDTVMRSRRMPRTL